MEEFMTSLHPGKLRCYILDTQGNLQLFSYYIVTWIQKKVTMIFAKLKQLVQQFQSIIKE